MDTPICDFVKKYIESDALRLHMPGHKGKGPLGFEALDITEIAGADVLYHADGVIRRSEQNAAGLFGSARTLYSAEGSSLSIRAMLYLVAVYARGAERAPLIAAGRNAHKTLITAAALLDLEVKWIFPSAAENRLSCALSAEELESFLKSGEQIPVAVYITDPDYLGNRTDLGALAAVCHRYGSLLLVDNAHGAYLHFLPQPEHPMDLGADLCCDSAHKTLPVLTGGGYLHIAESASPLILSMAENAMAMFASTSPSYLILQSLDAANRYLATDYPARLAAFLAPLGDLKDKLQNAGYALIGDEPLKLTVAPKKNGYTGTELAALLEQQGIVCEFLDPDYTVMMFTPEIGAEGLRRLEKALLATRKREPITEQPPVLPLPQAVLSPKQALFAPRERIPVKESRGRILAAEQVSCPPAVPIAVCGERIDEQVINCFNYYGLSYCTVCKE